MDNAAYIGLSHQTALFRQLEVVANNIANMNTTGFKGESTLFSDYIVKSRNDDRAFEDKIAFVQDLGMIRNMEQGVMEITNNPLDMAIRGDGFFAVESPQGEVMYTRDGRFTLSGDGQLSTHEGWAVLSSADTPIFFDPGATDIKVLGDGTITTANGEVARLKVVNFEDPLELKRAAGTLFKSEGMPAEDVEFPEIAHGAIEKSNVNPILELTRMIGLQRAYEQSNNLIKAEGERKNMAIKVFTQRV